MSKSDYAQPPPVDTTSLDYLLAQCHAGRDSAWVQECERRTRAEDEKKKGSC